MIQQEAQTHDAEYVEVGLCDSLLPVEVDFAEKGTQSITYATILKVAKNWEMEPVMRNLAFLSGVIFLVVGLGACEQDIAVTNDTATEVASSSGGSISKESQAEQQESKSLSETIESRFPDYQAKLSEDTVLDYRPSLAGEIALLPVITSETFTPAVFEIRNRHQSALQNEGTWEPGNMPLGADEREYVPSDEELLAAELGARISEFVKNLSHEEIMAAWTGGHIQPPTVEYDQFTFRHVDVMGSGRFFYASAPERIVIEFSGLQ